MTVEIRALRPDDDRQRFRCGDEALDIFFHRYAGQNQFRHHIGVTYVATERATILGFVTVSPGSLEADDLPMGRRMPPYPVPVLRIGRLAVAGRAQGTHVGEALLRFGIELAERMQGQVGCVGLIVDAKAGAVEFYRRLGFRTVEVVVGESLAAPRPTMMFLPLGAVPPKRPRRGV